MTRTFEGCFSSCFSSDILETLVVDCERREGKTAVRCYSMISQASEWAYALDGHSHPCNTMPDHSITMTLILP